MLRKGWRPELQAAIADEELDLESLYVQVRKPATCLQSFMARNLIVGMCLWKVQGKVWAFFYELACFHSVFHPDTPRHF